MPHALFLFPQLPSAEALNRFVEDGTLRAAAYGDFSSDYAGIGFATADTVLELGNKRSALAGADVMSVGGLLIPLPIVGSSHLPGPFTCFGFVTLQGGRQRTFAGHLRGHLHREEDRVRVASGLVLGAKDVHAMVEVVGDDLQEVSERFVSLADHPDVVATSSFVASPEHTVGFGSELARLG